MDIERKDAKITSAPDATAGPGTFEAVLSAPTKDRDGETLTSDTWKMPLPDRISVDIDHEMSVRGTIGSAKPWIDDTGNLRISGTFASTPLAQEVRTLMSEGHIDRTSVAFMSEPSTTKDGKQVKIRELLNAAVVCIPSNREAAVLEVRSAVQSSNREALVLASKGVKVGARNSATDMEHLQAIHDHASAAGATCAAKSAPAAEVKSIVGSLEATQDRARDALEDQYGQQFWILRGVLPDVLIFDLVDPSDYDTDTYRQPYTDDGAVITLTGSAEPVDVAEVVTPDADASREDTTLGFAAPAVKAAAPQSNDDAEQIALRAHALALMATCLASSEGD
ncbi:MAG: HK97 family phage prohead protease [Jatrophihabitantaceae bacterium]